MRALDYLSTRGEAPVLGFTDVLLTGLARDGGLYVPEIWPSFSAEEIAAFAGKPYSAVALAVLQRFTGGAFAVEKLKAMVDEAYATFNHPAVTPLVQIGENDFILELFRGPTLAFKDVAMQLLGRLMDAALAERGQRATIVAATSGDTGGAAMEAFRTCDRTDVFVLFPHGRVSDVQRRQMTTVEGDNIHAIAIEGDFDDCQALVKAMFNDHAFRDGMALAAVNSINWARIAAQITYYFVAGVALGAPHRAVSFVVPTGNFGDIFAGWVAKRMGLPVERLVVATNANDILARTLASGHYDSQGVQPTTSPSMDIQISSNFERLLFEVQGRNSNAVRLQMEQLKQSGSFQLPADVLADIRAEFDAARADNAETAATIGTVLKETGYLLDPHTAVAVAAGRKLPHDNATPRVILSTAHPAKFPDAVEEAAGIRPQVPEHMSALFSRQERFKVLPNDLAVLQAYVREHARIKSGS